ncbi:MAG: alanine racemase [Balneolaceae bacterium]|nr:alanine racemase [Balneolaceae bacterium]
MNLKSIKKPTLILDEVRCRKNINRVAERAKKAGCIFRPHFKTHQSIEVGKWIREAGVTGITVSSTSMAHYFAQDSWDDITIAFPFFPAQLHDLKELEKLSKLRLFLNENNHLQLLNDELENPFDFVIEIDPGFGRTGVKHNNFDLMDSLIQKSKKLEKCNFHGFYIHDGRTYQAQGKDGVKKAIEESISILTNLKNRYPDASVSLGDTPSSSLLDPSDFELIDEITPGNFVFYDWMQVRIGSCTLDEVALFVVLPAAQYFKGEKRAMLHGGAVHLSKDYIVQNGRNNFGQQVQFAQQIKAEDGAFITALSQEHGTLSGVSTEPKNGFVWICPIHSCLTANLHDYYLSADGRKIEKRILS